MLFFDCSVMYPLALFQLLLFVAGRVVYFLLGA